MHISTSDGGSYSINAHGQVTSVGESLGSDCGVDFDEYTRRALSEPFPYNSMSPASRDINDLWAGRTLKLYLNNQWREGKVLSWCQWNMGPFSGETHWSLKVELDTLEPRDVVEVHGLQGATQYNGKTGTIIQYIPEQERYKVKITGGGTNAVIAVKPVNLKLPVLDMKVCRMNIDGGGTLQQMDIKDPPLLSLEWLQPASPNINLDDGATYSNCPTCRAVEPPLAAYQEPVLTDTDQECPVCLETTSCRLLQCQHVVCDPCWTKWRRNSSGVPASWEHMDQLEEERAKRQQELLARIPHTRGGTATKPGDSDEVIEECVEASKSLQRAFLSQLIEDAHNGEQGLMRFHREVMVESLLMWCSEYVFYQLGKELPIPGIEALLQVFEDRKNELHTLSMADGLTTTDSFFHAVSYRLCLSIGEQYEEVNNYRGAIPWYRRALHHSRNQDDPVTVSEAHCNLGLALKYNGFLSEALGHYDKSLELNDNHDVHDNRKTLMREMKAWTGSSGKLTPGC